MRDSAMPTKWPTLSLREAGVSLIDCDHRTPPASEKGYPYIAIPQIKNGRIDLTNVRLITREHFLEWTHKAHPEPYDIILSRRCNPGETAFVPPGLECAVGQNLVLLRSNGEKVFKPFLRWIVRGSDWWRQVGKFINVGAVFDSLKCADIPNFTLPVPTLPEQRSIAHVLGTLDEKIELNQQMNTTLEEMAQAIFKHWFIDYEFPNEEGHPYKSSGGEVAYDADLGGEIPKGWRADQLGNHSIIKGRIGWKGLQVSEYVAEGPLIVGGTQLENDRVSWDECPRVPQKRYDESPEIMLRRGDILMTKDGTIGKLALVDDASEPATVASGIFVIRSNSSIINQMYLWNYFKSRAFESLVESRIEGSVIPHLYQRDITEMTIVLPTQRVAMEFEAVASAIQNRFAANSDNSGSLSRVRDSLLPKLMSGKIRVRVEG